MGYWGVKSYENDDANDAIDAAMERVHGASYDALTDDRDPTPIETIHARLAGPETLTATVEILRESVGSDIAFDDWDEVERLAFTGVIVLHAEAGVPITADWLARALDWLETESIDWDGDATVRRLRRQKEIAALRNPKPAT